MTDNVKEEQTKETEAPSVVDYEAHRKLLDEKKKESQKRKDLESRLAEFERAEEERQHKDLESKGEYEKILEGYKSKLGELEGKIESNRAAELSRKKTDAFLNALPGKLKNNQYVNFANLDDIGLSPDSGEVDPVGLKAAVDKFTAEHSALMSIGTPSSNIDRSAPIPHNSKPKPLNEMSTEELKQLMLKQSK